jgi:hypothetical protein
MLGSVSGAKLKFEPDPSWAWVGWDGVLELDAPVTHELTVNGKVALLIEDVLGCGTKLCAKNYKAIGFDSIPGTIVICTISVDESSVSKRLTVGGGKVCGNETNGTFVVACAPSMSGSTPPLPDPMLNHTGTWRFTAAGQQKLSI